MQFVSEPSNSIKMQKMKQRVRWQDPLIQERGIDQTEFVLDDGNQEDEEFSFMVIGDSGSGAHRGHNPQRQITEMMLQYGNGSRFVLHTGDVIYLVGSSEFYFNNFIDPYREFLVGGEKPKQIKFDRMVFNQPVLPVLGNHDYYDLPLLFGLLSQASVPFRHLFQSRIDFDVGWHGSNQGDAFARAFLDYLVGFSNRSELAHHLDQHYTAKGKQGRCLHYQPKQFTRLPNRYYSFRYGGIDFFALDSNTFNDPYPLITKEQRAARRVQLEQKRQEIEAEQQQLLEASMKLNPDNLDEAEQLDDLRTKLEHLEEMERDVSKQLAGDFRKNALDQEQLDWLVEQLVESWNTEAVRGRILYFHHPPYVTEATKWDQAQTLAVRYRLRRVLDRVAEQVGKQAGDRPLVDLVLNGHAHCLEHLRTEDTGHADSFINWIVCGGSGYSLRRQRLEGADLSETLTYHANGEMQLVTRPKPIQVARSHLFIGRSGQGKYKRRPYSFIKIEVKAGTPPKFCIRPFAAERHRQRWLNQVLQPFEIG